MRIINNFSKDEEIANAVSHIVGATLAIIGATVLIFHGIKTKSAIVITSFIIFGLGLIIMYTVSSIYHALHNNKAKYVFQILDHSAIYILIASTYTPFVNNAERIAYQNDFLSILGIAPSEVLVYLLTIGAYQFVRQDLWQRFWAAGSAKIARNGYWISIILTFITGVFIIC